MIANLPRSASCRRSTRAAGGGAARERRLKQAAARPVVLPRAAARRERGGPRPLAVAGARELVPLLARELRAGGDAAPSPGRRREGAAALVCARRSADERRRCAARASRAGACRSSRVDRRTHGRPVRAATRRRPRRPARASRSTRSPRRSRAARRARAPALAARLPVLREAVVRRADPHGLRAQNGADRRRGVRARRRHAGADAEPDPARAADRARLRRRSSTASRAPELAGVVGAGFGFRALAREALDLVPVAGWAVKGAVAYSGTRASARRAPSALLRGAPVQTSQ